MCTYFDDEISNEKKWFGISTVQIKIDIIETNSPHLTRANFYYRKQNRSILGIIGQLILH